MAICSNLRIASCVLISVICENQKSATDREKLHPLVVHFPSVYQQYSTCRRGVSVSIIVPFTRGLVGLASYVALCAVNERLGTSKGLCPDAGEPDKVQVLLIHIRSSNASSSKGVSDDDIDFSVGHLTRGASAAHCCLRLSSWSSLLANGTSPSKGCCGLRRNSRILNNAEGPSTPALWGSCALYVSMASANTLESASTALRSSLGRK